MITLQSRPATSRNPKQAIPFSRKNQRSDTRTDRRNLLLIALAAFAIRFIVVLLTYRTLPGSDHQEAFGWEQGWIARSLALGHGFSSPFQPLSGPTALVSPLYPLLLAAIFRIFGLYTTAAAFAALTVNALLSAATVLPVFLIARHTLTRYASRLPWAAAWLFALHPFAIFYSSTYLWDCTLTAFLFSWTFYAALQLHTPQAASQVKNARLETRATSRALSRHRIPTVAAKSPAPNLFQRPVARWAAFGFLYGLTALSNPAVLSLFPLLVIDAALAQPTRRRTAFKRLLFASATLAFTLLPWTLRNIRVLHAPIPMRDGFWLEFWAGNAGDTRTSNPPWTHPASNPAELTRYLHLGEIPYMAEKQQLALTHVSAHPVAFLVVSARRTFRFWTGFWSFSPAYRASERMDLPNLPFCTALTILTLIGARRLLQDHRRSALPFLFVLFVFPLPYYITHASMDYRQPIEPVISILVTLGGATLAETWRIRRLAKAQQTHSVLLAS